LTPAEGEVLWSGTNIRTLAEDYFAELTFIGHRNGVKEELTAVENLRFASGLSGRNLNREQARNALGEVGLKGRENLPARFLSEGQGRRLALARLLTSKSKLWVLDEVLTSLDKAAVSLVTSLIEWHLTEGGMAIVATHHEFNITAGSFQRLELA
jgi:heme exporter protein A